MTHVGEPVTESSQNSPHVAVCVQSKPTTGLLFIGDPHVEGRTPGFRRDNYPETVLGKLKWCLEYADLQSLQPVILGDLFDKPRDNPNWLMSRLLDLMGDRHIPIIFGNHDCANPHLDENDSLTLLAKAGAVELIDEFHLWACRVENRTVVIGGSPYRYRIPQEWTLEDKPISIRFIGENGVNAEMQFWKEAICNPGLMIWLTHHDLVFPNPYEAVVTQMNEIPGIDFLINGHIHRRASADVVRGQTTWINPGNIARRSRSDSIRGHVPSVLRMDVANDGQWMHYITIPHENADDVFYDLALPEADTAGSDQSNFVTGLALLQSRKTDSGAGLMPFLVENVSQFESDVAAEILKLAELVLADSNPLTEPT
jgi:predicted phosphodiesterase